ncbi:DUF3887 domain-containing protein [Geminocystis sp. GBBB08]|uniref:DUF3887 domain-containing protein n=1 Tax=Geminocystis sp. GBBB08 TaxID=2604140 RepID=UPI0027E28324|nr:DUF3887 domain-containing protein [Geminocystis sp. GBBB08]MBL1211514.1 DUF3887 domain-containing protein [Geminocystis sp. GBBB08]
MKISRFIVVSCFSIVLGGLSYQTSSYAEKSQNLTLISQTNNQDNSSNLEAKGKKIIDLFFTQKFQSIPSLFSSQLREEISQDMIKQIWNNTNKQNGNFKGIKDFKQINTPNSDLAVFSLNFDKVTQEWIIIFNKKGEVIGVDIPTNQNIDDISRNFIDSLVSGNSAEARFYLHPFLKENITPKQLQARWDNFVKANGEFKGITRTTVRNGSKGDDTDVVIMDLEFNRNKEEIFVIFDSSKSIIGVDFIQ